MLCTASTSSAKPSTSAYNVDDEFGSGELTRVTEENPEDENTEAVTSVKCAKNAKGVRNSLVSIFSLLINLHLFIWVMNTIIIHIKYIELNL